MKPFYDDYTDNQHTKNHNKSVLSKAEDSLLLSPSASNAEFTHITLFAPCADLTTHC